MNKRIFLSCLLIIILLNACDSKIGYGVVLWTDPLTSYRSGEIIEIMSKSDSQKTYVIKTRDGKNKIEIPYGKIAFYEKRKDAEAYKDKYSEWINLYAYSNKNALPVREENNPDSTIIYKLRIEEVVKILEREPEQTKIGSYENYWYKILTESGFSGYCFGERLTVFEAEDDAQTIAEEFQSFDSKLEEILENLWYPEYYKDMIRTGEFDFRKFSKNIGLFPDREENEITIRTDEDSFHFYYDSITKLGNSTYVFEGTTLRLEISPWNTLSATFSDHGQLTTLTFILVEQPVSEIINEEVERRYENFKDFENIVFSSDAYGDLRFGNNMTFEWNNYDRLVPKVIGSSGENSGIVKFLYYMGSSIISNYDGIITFIFNGTDSYEGGIDFLYNIDENGVKFTHVEKYYINELTVNRTGASPIIMYFNKTE